MTGFREWLKINEMGAVGPYIGGCGPHKDFIVQGACSQLNTDKENSRYRRGDIKPRRKSGRK